MRKGTCPRCGRTRWLLGGLLGLHQNLGGAVCAGSGGPPWAPARSESEAGDE